MKPFFLIALPLLFLSACSPPTSKATPEPAQQQSLPAALMAPLAAPNTTLASQSAQAKPSGEPQNLQEVRQLAAQRRAELTGKPGWLHVQTRVAQAHQDPLSPIVATVQASSSGDLTQYVQDQWLALNADGSVRQAVSKISNETGKTLQVSLFDHGVWNNLTLGAQTEAAPFDPNYGFDALAASLVRQGYSLNKSVLYKECWYQGEKYTISDGHTVHEAVFNSGYRQLRWIKTWQVEKNGDVAPVDSLEVLVEERVNQPPAEVLGLLPQAAVINK